MEKLQWKGTARTDKPLGVLSFPNSPPLPIAIKDWYGRKIYQNPYILMTQRKDKMITKTLTKVWGDILWR